MQKSVNLQGRFDITISGCKLNCLEIEDLMVVLQLLSNQSVTLRNAITAIPCFITDLWQF